MSKLDIISDKIAKELNLDEERKKVISYGLFAFFQTIISLLLVILFGSVLKIAFQALVASFTSNILRQFSGGAHATKPSICLFIGTSVALLVALLARYTVNILDFTILLIVGAICYLYMLYTIIKKAPVDNEMKKIRTTEKKKKMKRISVIVLVLFFIISLFLFVYYFYHKNLVLLEYSMCITIALFWQVFTLTIAGHKSIAKIDNFIRQFIYKERKEKT